MSRLFCIFLPCRNSPGWTKASSLSRIHDHRHATVGRTPLDGWSSRRRDLYLTTPDTHDRYQCPRRDSNPQPQQASGRRHTPQTARQPELAIFRIVFKIQRAPFSYCPLSLPTSLLHINASHSCFPYIHMVIRNDCRGFNNLSYTIHLR